MYDGWRRTALLAQAGSRVHRGARVRGPIPRHPDGGCGPAHEVGTWANTGAVRPTLGALNRGAHGNRRDLCYASAKGWCHSIRWCCSRVGCLAILNTPSCGKLALTIVVAGVSVLFGGHVWEEGGLHTVVQSRQTDLEACPYLSLDLSFTESHRAKRARSCCINLALECRLRLTFPPTLSTLSVLGIHILNASWTQIG